LLVGDVMGKGVHAASLMGRLRAAAQVLVSVDPSPCAVLDGLNDVLIDMDTDRVATVAYVLIDSRASQARVALAGHPPPVLVSVDGASCRCLGDQNVSPLLGLPDAERSETVVDLVPGVAVILYTDGLVETEDGSADGLQRLMKNAKEAQRDGASIERLADALLETSSPVSDDDVALLVARIVEVSQPAVGED
jgi:serine phosphatase RsbU (regulator of sigma subunit)